MKRALKNKLSGSKKLVRRVLSKSSNISHESTPQNQEVIMTEEALATEIAALREQIANLKAAINSLSEETEQKEVAIAKLAREKEQLHLDLLKQKRSNNNLTQQLEDERNFYFKEKEIYCQEMNECKKLKRLVSGTSALTGEEKTVSDYKIELMKIKQTLNQTLEANYNLSIKFLRMKNTKTCLKTELKTMKLEHERLENDYKAKIENLSSELNDLVNEKLQTEYMSPSSKKYLQLVKQNSCLVYENLCLQLEVDNLHLKFERLKLERTKSETNNRLKYIHHEKEEDQPGISIKHRLHKETKRVKIQNEVPEKLEKEPQPSCSKSRLSKDEKYVKIYERKQDEKVVKIYERKQMPGIPDIRIINEREVKPKEKKVKRKTQNVAEKGREHGRSSSSSKNSSLLKEETDISNDQLKFDDRSKKAIENKNNSKLALFQVSDMQSIASGDCVSLTPSAITRSHSSPEIVQTSLFRRTSNDKTYLT